MTRNAVSRDARAFALTRAALTLLVARGAAGATGKELFGESSRDGWGRNLLYRMIDRGLVTVLPRAPHTRVRTFVATESLSAIVDDDQRISTLMWPSGKVGVREEDVERAAKQLGEPGAEIEEPSDDEEDVPDDRPSTPPESGVDDIESFIANLPKEEVIPALVKLCSATLQNVVYMRTRLDTLISEIKKLREAWE